MLRLSHRHQEPNDGLGQHPLGWQIKRGDAATAPLSVTLIAHELRVADVAKQIDAKYDQPLQRLSQAALRATSSVRSVYLTHRLLAYHAPAVRAISAAAASPARVT